MSSIAFALRETLRPLLPERAFLRRASEDATFVTNAPIWLETPPELPNFRCALRGKRLLISPDAPILTAFEERHPHPTDYFCESLLRFRGTPPCEEALRLFAVGVRLLECCDANESKLYDRRARQLAALCLRENLGGTYACALLAEQIRAL